MKYLLGLGLWSSLAFGQTEATKPVSTDTQPTPSSTEATTPKTPTDPTAAPSKVERMTVTGSHIKKLDVELASPVSTIDANQIKETGEVSVGDVLRKEVYNSFGSRRENSGGSASGAAYINLRGVGENRTLVLLNGKRISRDIQNGAVDLNMLPVSAIERIDILRDGASAIYGSDALGGVVNIITKKNFEGSQYAMRFLTPEKAGGMSREFSFTGGGSSGKTSFLNMLSYRESDTLNSNQRDFLHPNWVNQGSPGTFRGDKTKKWIVDPTCPANRINQRGTSCSFDVAQDSIRKPSVKTLSLLSSFEHELNSRATLFTQVFASRKNVDWYWSPTADERNILIPAASRGILEAGAGRPVFAGIPAAENIELQYRLVELGRETKSVEATSFGINSGIKGSIGDAWTYEVSAAQDRKYENEVGTGVALKDRLNELIDTGAYNPFKPEGQHGSIDGLNYTPYNKKISLTKSIDATFSGPIAEMPYGELSLAVGGEGRKEMYSEAVDSETQRGNTWGTLKGNSGDGDRTVSSGFLELSIPAYKKLDVTLSGRYDKYSDYGSNVSPKIAASYRPFDWMFVRASIGSGFKAPTLFEMYRNENLQYVSGYRDYSYCQANNIAVAKCPTRNGYITQSGNKNLNQETSQFQNLGLGFEPLKDLTLNVDYWAMNIKDEIGYIDTDALLKAQAANVDISKFGASAERDPITGETTNIKTVYQNLGHAELRGIDTSLDYRLRFDSGTYGFRTAYSAQIRNKET
ncbi:MAG: TonB-dependent receptor, partial [Chitinophagaceae bacterium]|nr:TonB-dependent receptor [Oligoflexus sp.]